MQQSLCLIGIRVMMAVLLGAALTAGATARAGEESSVAALKLGGLANLAYFAEKVRQKQPVVIGFIGGSITQGAGASTYGNNYYWKTRTALAQEIVKRGAQAAIYNVAIGGTGSGYACYRAGAQLLFRKPDLLIIEFAVNDTSDPNAAESMECLVRQALRANPRMGIVLFYTTTEKIDNESYAKGVLPRAVVLHHQVAVHYGLAEVLAGQKVSDGFKSGTYAPKTFFVDGVHPSDIGYGVYATLLTEALLPMFDLPAPAAEPAALPALLGKGALEYARLEAAEPQGTPEGWVNNPKAGNWYEVGIWVCDQPGKPLVFRAKGEGIQIVFQGKIKIRWTVGGKEHTQELTGRSNMPMPGSWMFPKDANPDQADITAEAVPDASGKAHGEVWGLFSVQQP